MISNSVSPPQTGGSVGAGAQGANQQPTATNASLFRAQTSQPGTHTIATPQTNGMLAQQDVFTAAVANGARPHIDALRKEDKESSRLDDPALDDKSSENSVLPTQVQERDQQEQQGRDEEQSQDGTWSVSESGLLDGFEDEQGVSAHPGHQMQQFKDHLIGQYLDGREQKEYQTAQAVAQRLSQQEHLVADNPQLNADQLPEQMGVQEALNQYGEPLANKVINGVFPDLQKGQRRLDDLSLMRSRINEEMHEFGGGDNYQPYAPQSMDLEEISQLEYTTVLGMDLRALDGQIGIEKKINTAMSEVLQEAFAVRALANPQQPELGSDPEDVELSLHGNNNSLAFNQLNQELNSLLSEHKDAAWDRWSYAQG